MDGGLRQLAVSVSAHGQSSKNTSLIKTRRLEQEGEFVIQVWKDNKLAYTSHPFIEVGLQQEPGFGNTTYEYGILRYYKHIRNGDVIQVFQSFDERQDMLGDMQRYFFTHSFSLSNLLNFTLRCYRKRFATFNDAFKEIQRA